MANGHRNDHKILDPREKNFIETDFEIENRSGNGCWDPELEINLAKRGTSEVTRRAAVTKERKTHPPDGGCDPREARAE